MKLAFWILVVLVILIILAIKYLPWWALIAVIVLGALTIPWALKQGMKQVLLLPFKAKGQVLKGATVQVHQVQSTNMPTLRQGSDMDVATFADLRERYHQLKWYTVDASISPVKREADVPFSAWEPGDLMLVPPGKKVKDIEGLAENDVSEIHDYEIYETNRFQQDMEGKHLGSQRVKFLVGVQPGVQTLQFRYYLELFGEVEFPFTVNGTAQLKPA
ncbi:hypothetical protein IQ266_20405 [filamentous cyanobacterium LEGE 11480]|uniref:Uncharacterized protein n=2 Tax=Romeriopsis TaxID=2992131 RepID=A0A928Z4U1_9CYAN|nr:hypothetical protein [Romeriopsis navalis LEGE 11480]